MPYQKIASQNGAGLFAWTGGPQTAGWTGYLLTTGADDIPSLAPDAAWNVWSTTQANGGIYLFAPSAPSDPEAFLAGVLSYVSGTLNAATAPYFFRYFLWFPDTGAAPAAIEAVNFVQGGRGGGQTQTAVSVNFQNLQLLIAAGTIVTPDFSAPAFNFGQFGQPGAYQLQFVNTIGTTVTVGAIDAGGVTLDAGQAAPGRMSFLLNASATSTVGENDLQKLRAGVEFSYTDPASGNFIGLFSPVLDTAAAPFSLQVMLDPLHPLDAARTAFTFAPGPGNAPPPVFASFYRTDIGDLISLTPVAGDAGFVLQNEMYPIDAIAQGASQTPTYYCAPTGRFQISSAGTSTALLCGLSGTESVTFTPAAGKTPGDILRFYPDQPAYAPVFPLGTVDLRQTGPPPVGDLLHADYTTSWATVSSASAANVYQSQPPGGAMYHYAGDPGDSDRPMLEYFVTPAATLGADTAANAFPLAAYAGVGNAGTHPFEGFESQIVGPRRHAAIIAGAVKAASRGAIAAAAATTVTTPQGLLASVAGDTWQTLQLAQNDSQTLLFTGVDPALKSALQANQQFLVITQWPAATAMQFANEISIDDWPFLIDVAAAGGTTLGDYKNVLIFKFIPGKLSDLVTNPSNWTAAAAFNATDGQGLAFLSQWIQDYIADARQMAAMEQQQGLAESYFQKFLDVVDNPAWNGVIVLKADVDASALPKDIRGLLGAMDLSRFNAHHVGLEVSFVQAASGNVAVSGNSSLFGLVYYVDAGYAAKLALGGDPAEPIAAAAGDYDYKVLTLKALFENTALKTFSSKLQVTVNEWFGDRVVSIVNPTGATMALPSFSIILDGVYQHHDVHPVFTFGANTDRLFALDSNILGVIEVVQAQFATITTTGGPNGDLVQSRFTFSCYLNFKPNTGNFDPATPFDLFSFGSSWQNGQPGTQQGLFASNVAVDVQFPNATPASRTLAFDTSAITFDVVQSVARPASFYPNFPLKLAGFLTGPADKSPTDLGYLGVSVVGGGLSGVSGPWNALMFTLDLGTAGALAASAGFTAPLLMVWSPGSGAAGADSYSGMAALQLPGTGGPSKLMSLQGILKLSVKDIQLVAGKTQGGNLAYMLKLTQIALKFLGIAFPGSGDTAVFVFGDPTPGALQNTVGWYAAYVSAKGP